jgi:hypothetical protein
MRFREQGLKVEQEYKQAQIDKLKSEAMSSGKDTTEAEISSLLKVYDSEYSQLEEAIKSSYKQEEQVMNNEMIPASQRMKSIDEIKEKRKGLLAQKEEAFAKVKKEVEGLKKEKKESKGKEGKLSSGKSPVKVGSGELKSKFPSLYKGRF